MRSHRSPPHTHTQKPEERSKNADGKLERKDTVAYTEYGAKGKVTPYLMKKLKTLQASIHVFFYVLKACLVYRICLTVCSGVLVFIAVMLGKQTAS